MLLKELNKQIFGSVVFLKTFSRSFYVDHGVTRMNCGVVSDNCSVSNEAQIGQKWYHFNALLVVIRLRADECSSDFYIGRDDFLFSIFVRKH